MPGFTLAAAASIAAGLTIGAAAAVGVTIAVEGHAAVPATTPATQLPTGPYLVNYGDRCWRGHCIPWPS
ncbi:DUF2613 family protein [Mycobacterium shigaense]|uniref:Uncharacterized protein n=1 Tax=Mycobacterium shigaense TaxID=722731 RepID=A0A1Z4ECC3_9MYCO|nr:DUF2613 family protein [Mycobacterium shigaense]MEA1122522.1 DUF2613 family protein [Mycobacterium shigaense]PRI17171.1 hypothetical protein B2J96_01575 [Mycobacterium shigaense]BAX90602.1 hypothetical protein MSG_00436 [Mycobacterium shigaense]